MLAVGRGHLECVSILAPKENGLKSKFGGDTALMLGATKGHLECVKVLAPLEKGESDIRRMTALSYASTKECAEFLWQFPEEREIENLGEVKKKYGLQRTQCAGGTSCGSASLIEAAILGCSQCVEKFIGQAGRKGKHGESALIEAARFGYADLAEMLLDREHGMRDNLRMSALMHAAKEGHADVVGLLLRTEKGLVDSTGRTALQHAAEGNHPECVALLAGEAGMSTVEKTALMLEAERGHAENVRLLLGEAGR